ncbi:MULTISPECIES: ATP-binding protein [unclassified Dehalobacter]|uniref:AlbA family DNA-binding domain-containing protein n=1 Tax=unclassified Dehalobacter TaxID=2635733 RepID=UPI00039D4A4F|nr:MULTISPECIES: ATP-binding protein [unclassified Dehalobacter]TCX49159.1 ATP-binding protein [Dehalobacter sp. 14DCB1]TCX55305.1 ATP-binding protein [Dehalobacter sp. 12DCB1]
MDIDDLIRFENENTALDFKATQYVKEQYESLIKDVMAMANSNVQGDRYIIVGVKHQSSGDRELLGIERTEFVDPAVYQQLILENIEPNILLNYSPYEFESKVFGVFIISNCIDRPYMMKKDYKNLKKGDSFIRKGSQQTRMERRDFDQIFASRTNRTDYDKFVSLSFKGFRNTEEIELPAVKRSKLPSERAKEKIIKILEQKRVEPEPTGYLRAIRSMGSLSYFGGTPYENRTIEELEKNLANVNETYRPDDYYETYELHSHKLNITIVNDGQSYLEDCSIKVEVKKAPGLLLASRLYHKPEHNSLLAINSIVPRVETITYPDVDSTEDAWIITQQIGDIRHQIPTDAFDVDIRIVFSEKIIGNVINFECRLFGKNLSHPLQRTLRIKVIE